MMGITEALALAVASKKAKQEVEVRELIKSSGASLIRVEFGKKFGRPKETWEFTDKSRLSVFPATALWAFECHYIVSKT